MIEASEPASVPVPAPAARAERVESLDVIRGFALLGILLMNIPVYGLGFGTMLAPHLFDLDATGRAVWAVNKVFSDGTMRALFGCLFGAGVVLLTSRLATRSTPGQVARIYYSRVFWLMVFGAVDAYLFLWFGDILFAYGFMGLFLYFLRNVRASRLAIFGVVCLVLTSGLQIGMTGFMTDYQETVQAVAALPEDEAPSAEQQEMLDQGAEGGMDIFTFDADKLALEKAARLGSYSENFDFNAVYAWPVAIMGALMAGILDGLWTMVLGMALFKYGVLSGEKSTRFYLGMVLIGYPLGLILRVPGVMAVLASDFDVIVSMEAGMYYHIARGAIAMANLAVVILIVKGGLMKAVTDRLASVGRMAFTNYILHTLMAGALFYGIGFGMFGAYSWQQLYIVLAGMWVVNIVFSHWWLARYRFGPLEWIWRSLTYLKPQPLKRA